ncbi:MAG: protein-L-isoaspartate(D-aspartate) O-methyltransferase [Stellaceae bacterium]
MTEPASHTARKARLVKELRRAGIADARVLGAIEKTPREMFVGAAFHNRAYDNVALPIGDAQTISQPYVVALMTEKLALSGREKVLEIGTGSGYQAAILARLARHVFTVERHRALLREAERRFAALGLGNVVTRLGDGGKGWPEQAPFDRIIVTAAAREVPSVLVKQLAPGGLMVLPVGAEYDDQRLVLVRRHDPAHESAYETEDLAWVRFVPLVAGLPRDGETAESHDDLVDERIAVE